MTEHSKSTSKRYQATLKVALAEVDRLKADLDKAKLQRDAMFHEIETMRGKTGYCIGCEKATREKSLVEHQLAEITAAHDRLRRAVNSTSGDCSPECDTYSHADDCEHVDVSSGLIKLQAENERLRKAGDALARLLKVTMTDSMTTHSDDPGCFHCDDGMYARLYGDDGHDVEGCPAKTAHKAWRAAAGGGEG